MLLKRFVAAAKVAVSKDETRRALNFIRIQDGHAIATDGHVLVVQECEDPNSWLAPGSLKAMDTIVTRNGDETSYAEQKGVVTSHKDPFGDADCFPKWKSVMPSGWNRSDKALNAAGYEFRVGLNPELLIGVLKAFDPGMRPVRIYIKDETHPVLLLQEPSGDQPERKAIIMPIRVKK